MVNESMGDSQDYCLLLESGGSVPHSDLFAFSNSKNQVRKAIMVAAGGEIWRKNVKKNLSTLSERR